MSDTAAHAVDPSSVAADQLKSLSVAGLLAVFDRDEIWRPVANWPGYSVSSWGRVQRFGKYLKPANISGYAFVSLSKNNDKKSTRLHHLVAEAFLGGKPFDGAIIAHNDGDKSNIRASNLRWASARENQVDRRRHGTACRGSAVFGAKLREEQIPSIRQRIASGEPYRSIGEAFGVSLHTIYQIKKNKIWKHARGAAWATGNNPEIRA